MRKLKLEKWVLLGACLVVLSAGVSALARASDVVSRGSSSAASIEALDFDGDGIPDEDDADVDGDGIPNGIEEALGLDPRNPADAEFDLDGDQALNLDEYRAGTRLDYLFSTPAGDANRVQKVFANDGAGGDELGTDVAIDGDTAVIGASRDDDNGTDSGSVRVFRLIGGTWFEEAKLVASDGETYDRFGISVDLAGDILVVGASWDDDNGSKSGSAYVFTRDGSGFFAEQAKLTPSDGATDRQFGSSIALDDETIVVGAPSSAYVFVRSQGEWTEQAVLTTQDAGFLGSSVAVAGDTAVIGAPYDSDDGTFAGAAYVFTRTDGIWTQQAKLRTGVMQVRAHFGESVAVSGDTAVVGAPGTDSGDIMSVGAAYVFTRSTGSWTQQARLIASESYSYGEFGQSVSLSDDLALVGADDQVINSGSAYLFTRSGDVWTEQTKLVATDGESYDSFGTSVAVSDGMVVIGATGDDDVGPVSGAAYFYASFCGNDVVEDAEECDDGNLEVEDGCSGSCQLEVCGDGVVQGTFGEQCDDGNIESEDGCTADCGHEFLDGDGYPDALDADIDGDGIPNWIEEELGLDPRDPADAQFDLDRDGWTNVEEYRQGTEIDDLASTPDDVDLAQKIFAGDGRREDKFGNGVALSGDTALVAAQYKDGNESSSGVVYVFSRVGDLWTEEAQLVARDGATFDLFGSSVALSGNTAVIGALGDDDNALGSSSAYVFRRVAGIWIEAAKLLASDGGGGFGVSVAVSGDTIVIGALGDDYGGTAYVFGRTGGTWVEQAKLRASDGMVDDSFGVSVAVSGDTALVGAYHDGEPSGGANGYWSGSAYVFTRLGSDWTEQAKLLASDAKSYDNFGFSVALSGDTALIGSQGDDDRGINSGSAYVFTRTGDFWTEETKLTASDGAGDDYFGSSVALSSDTAVIGASRKSFYRGAAYLFERTGTIWLERARLTGDDSALRDLFGSTVAASGDCALVGSPGNDDAGAFAGAARFIVPDLSTCDDPEALLESDDESESSGSSCGLGFEGCLVACLILARRRRGAVAHGNPGANFPG